jgi:hypothetical protein
MLPFIHLWLASRLYVVVRCPACRQGDVHVPWPRLFDYCEDCGAPVFGGPEPFALVRGVPRGP